MNAVSQASGAKLPLRSSHTRPDHTRAQLDAVCFVMSNKGISNSSSLSRHFFLARIGQQLIAMTFLAAQQKEKQVEGALCEVFSCQGVTALPPIFQLHIT